jgi:DNA-binding TFAR19-related protein (PDSD5 family)
MQQHEAQRESILEQILEPAAKVRIQRLHLVKKEKARAIEVSFYSNICIFIKCTNNL